jgi:hypothetical protein
VCVWLVGQVPTLGCGPSMLGGAPVLDDDRHSSHNRLLCTFTAQLEVAHCIQLHVLSRWLLTVLEEVQVRPAVRNREVGGLAVPTSLLCCRASLTPRPSRFVHAPVPVTIISPVSPPGTPPPTPGPCAARCTLWPHPWLPLPLLGRCPSSCGPTPRSWPGHP